MKIKIRTIRQIASAALVSSIPISDKEIILLVRNVIIGKYINYKKLILFFFYLNFIINIVVDLAITIHNLIVLIV